MKYFIMAMLKNEERSRTVLAAITAVAGIMAIVFAVLLNTVFPPQ